MVKSGPDLEADSRRTPGGGSSALISGEGGVETRGFSVRFNTGFPATTIGRITIIRGGLAIVLLGKAWDRSQDGWDRLNPWCISIRNRNNTHTFQVIRGVCWTLL